MVLYWKSVFQGDRPEQNAPIQIKSTNIDHTIHAPITSEDLKCNRLEASTSPGPDGMQVKEWNSLPTDIRVAICNLILWCRDVPHEFHKARTSMIPKVKGADRPELFRPITIAPVLCRALHKVLAARLSRTRICEAHRPFIKSDGCADAVTLTDFFLRDSRKTYASVYIVQFDLTKAFDMVTHEAIAAALRGNGAPLAFVEYMKNIYRGQRTVIEGDCWTSEEIAPNRGVRQGDPLSPTLFILLIDGLISSLPTRIGYRMGNQVINCIAYADDITLIVETPESLQELLDITQEYLEKCGLKINVTKSRTLAFQGQKKEKKQVIMANKTFTVLNRPLQSAKATDEWKYLGVIFNGGGRVKFEGDLNTELDRLDRAALKPQQKLFALRTCLIPRLFHVISLGLVYTVHLKKMDSDVRKRVRKWLRLPQDVPIAYFHAAIADGGLGLPALRWFGPMLRYKRLDKVICGNDIHAYELELDKSKSYSLAKWRDVHLTSSDLVRGMWSVRLSENVDGVGLKEACRVKSANSFIGDGTRLLSARDFVHIAQTRINALYSRSRTMRRRHGVSRQCRAGCGSIETTNHISQVCNSTKQFRIDRHDCIVSHLEARFLELGYHVEREPIIDIGQQTLKPDLVGHCGKTIIVCDI